MLRLSEFNSLEILFHFLGNRSYKLHLCAIPLPVLSDGAAEKQLVCGNRSEPGFSNHRSWKGGYVGSVSLSSKIVPKALLTLCPSTSEW